MSFLLGVLKIIILLGTLVTIHELGHFFVAKSCNVKVHKFSIGFGPKLFTKIKGETEYSLRLIPFGGFVQLEGEDIHSDDVRAFNNKPIWQRMLIIVAGATINIVFALLLYFGITASVNMYVPAIVENVEQGTIAYTAGLRKDDVIKKVNGKDVVFQTQVADIISNAKDSNVMFEVERNGSIKELTISIPEIEIGRVGVAFTNDGEVAYLQNGSVAQNVGIEIGDKIISINGFKNLSVIEFTEEIKKNANKDVEIVLERDGEEKTFHLIPVATNVKVFEVDYKVISNLNFFENSYYAINETRYYFTETLKAFGRLVTGKTENASVMGPVGIVGEITKTQGWTEFFYLMSAISLSLGIFNLLPIPGLDGGKFLFLIIECIRKKPLKEKTEIAWQLAGFALIITLAIIVTIKDVINLF